MEVATEIKEGVTDTNDAAPDVLVFATVSFRSAIVRLRTSSDPAFAVSC